MIEQGSITEASIGLLKGRIRELRQWESNPGEFEGKETITSREYQAVRQELISRFGDRVRESSLAINGAPISEEERDLVYEIINSIQGIEEEEIKNEKRRPWDVGCVDHFYKVTGMAVVIAEELGLDASRIEVRALLHDIGRFGSHHPILHGLTGRELLRNIGFARDFQITTLTHLEAGAGPYVVGITSETWPELSQDLEKLERAIGQAPIEEVLIAMADMGRGDDPIRSLVGSVKRRLTTERGEPKDKTLIALASDDENARRKAMVELERLGADQENINRMAMYFGLCHLLKAQLEEEGFIFNNETISRSRMSYERLLEEKPIKGKEA